MNVHKLFPVALVALPFALACGSPPPELPDALADVPSRTLSEPVTPEAPLALLDAYSTDDAAALSERLFQMGVDVEALRVDGDEITAEGDMVFSATELLGDSKQVVNKGFRSNGTASAPIVRSRLMNIQLIIDTTLISPWINAAKDAAAAWSATGIVNISELNTGDRVTLSFASLGCATAPCALASTTLPQGGRVGSSIEVNTDVTATAADARRAALHELGHALGFVHPGEGAHIGGTDGAVGTYATVMNPTVDRVSPSLTPDDLLSLQRLYAPTSQAEFCNAVNLVICPATGQCVSPLDLLPLRCDE
jgi:hypothetical protein